MFKKIDKSLNFNKFHYYIFKYQNFWIAQNIFNDNKNTQYKAAQSLSPWSHVIFFMHVWTLLGKSLQSRALRKN